MLSNLHYTYTSHAKCTHTHSAFTELLKNVEM